MCAWPFFSQTHATRVKHGKNFANRASSWVFFFVSKSKILDCNMETKQFKLCDQQTASSISYQIYASECSPKKNVLASNVGPNFVSHTTTTKLEEPKLLGI
jgi:hypothetical protein